VLYNKLVNLMVLQQQVIQYLIALNIIKILKIAKKFFSKMI